MMRITGKHLFVSSSKIFLHSPILLRYHYNMDTDGIIIYSHYGCLGHTTRATSLARETELDCLSYSPPQEFLDYQRFPFRHYFLSQPVLGKTTFFSPQRALFSRERIKEVLKIITKYHHIVFEYFPFGRFQLAKEYRYLITALKKLNKRIITSVGYPILNPNRVHTVLSFLKDFDQIWFHCDSREVRFWQELNPNLDRFLHLVSPKTRFTGYIPPQPLPLKEVDTLPNLDPGYILVLRGSGIVLEQLVKVVTNLGKEARGQKFVLVLGPSSQPFLTKNLPPNITIIRSTPKIPDLIANARLVITTASYNTSVQLLLQPKPAIFIPFTGTKTYPGINEQPIRARFLTSILSPSRIIVDRELSVDRLREEISEILADSEKASLSYSPKIATKTELKRLLPI